MNQKGNEPMKKRQSVLFDDDAISWLEAQAKKQRRSVSEILRIIVEYARENGWGE